MGTTKKKITKKKTAKKAKLKTTGLRIEAASNGYVLIQDLACPPPEFDYETRKTIFVSTDALLEALEAPLRDLRDAAQNGLAD